MIQFDEKFWVGLSFILLIVSIYKPLKNMILSGLNSKRDKITKTLLEAEKLKEDAEKLLLEAERKKLESEAEAKLFIKDAETHAAELLQEAELKAEKLVQRKLQLAEEKIEEFKNNSIRQLIQETFDSELNNFTDDFTKNYSESDHFKLIQNSVNDISDKLSTMNGFKSNKISQAS